MRLANLVIHAPAHGDAGDLPAGNVEREHPRFLRYTVIIVVTGSVLFVGHFLEVTLWVYTYAAVGAAPPGTDLVHRQLHNAR
jgi:hypothetical protein